jgi:hypothetical protein
MNTRIFLLGLLVSLAAVAAAEPLYIYSGEGVTVVVLAADEDEENVSGEIRYEAGAHPFTATVAETDEGTIVNGSFHAGGAAKRFRATVDEDEGTAMLVMDGKSYRLAGVDAIPEMRPGPKPHRAPSDGKAVVDANAAATVRLKRVSFPDVSMGGVPAYTMLIPEAWTAEGKIEWPPVDNPYPQPSIRIKGTGGEKITMIPVQHFGYVESANMAPQGTPPPPDIGQWLVETIRRTNPAVSDVKLVSNRRHPEAEANARKGLNPGIGISIHTVTITYEEEGVGMKEEINFGFSRYAPVVTQYIRTDNWSLFVYGCAAAPEESFERLKPQVYAYANTFAPLPRWWNQMMQARQEIINLRSDRIAGEIRRRGQFYSDMSDRQHAAFMSRTRSDDEIQRKRIQGIYEVQDYRDPDGSRVELPFHYKHVFSDGKGNYVMSNTYEKPGEGFQEIQAAE